VRARTTGTSMRRMARRPRLRAPEAIGAVLPRTEATRAPITVDAPPVSAQDWELAVGSQIAWRARPLKLERGVLHVRAATSTWAQELSMLADTILRQLRARGMNVRSLRFLVGPVEPIARPAWRSDVRVVPEPAALPAEVRATLAAVPDPELRDAIARAAATALGQAKRAEEIAAAEKVRPRPPRRRQGSQLSPSPPPEARPESPRARRGDDVTSPRSGAPAPRSAAPRSAPPDRTTPARRAAPRGTRGGPSAPGS